MVDPQLCILLGQHVGKRCIEANVLSLSELRRPPLPAAREEFAADIGVIKANNKAQRSRHESAGVIHAGCPNVAASRHVRAEAVRSALSPNRLHA
jgi:hypothetical protein